MIFACSSKPVEEYVDYFYTYKGGDQRNSFTYILYLGEEGSHRLPEDNTDLSKIPQRQRQPSNDNKKSARKSNKGNVDDFISISFRMEEEAFDRLEKLLIEKDYCKGEVEYEHNEYTWLRYTIKGHCVP